MKAYVDIDREYYRLVTGTINTNAPAGYTPVALSTPVTVTAPVINGEKYLVTVSSTYFAQGAATGEIDIGPCIGTSPINPGTWGAHTGTYGIPTYSRAIYTATSTGNVTFQVCVSSAAASTVRIDSPMITVKHVY